MLFNLTHGFPFDSSPLIHNFHITDYCVMSGSLLKNQDQDTGSPDPIFAEFILVIVVDSSAKYTKE